MIWRSILVLFLFGISVQASGQSTTGLESVIIEDEPSSGGRTSSRETTAPPASQPSTPSETTSSGGRTPPKDRVLGPVLGVHGDLRLNPNYKPIGLGGNSKVSRQCQSAWLSKEGGGYGPRAKLLLEEIKKSSFRKYFVSSNIPQVQEICPKSVNWGVDERLNFWALLFTNVAYHESNCTPMSPVHICVNAPCAGEMQLEEDYDMRVGRLPKSHRIPGLPLREHNTGCRGDQRPPGSNELWAQNIQNTMSCTVEIMGSFLCGRHTFRGVDDCTKNEPPFGRKPPTSYWEDLNDGDVKAKIKLSPLCR